MRPCRSIRVQTLQNVVSSNGQPSYIRREIGIFNIELNITIQLGGFMKNRRSVSKPVTHVSGSALMDVVFVPGLHLRIFLLMFLVLRTCNCEFGVQHKWTVS